MIGGSCRAKRIDNGEWIIGEMEPGGQYISRYTKHIRQSLESEETSRVISRYDSMTTKVDQDTICGYSGRLDKNCWEDIDYYCLCDYEGCQPLCEEYEEEEE